MMGELVREEAGSSGSLDWPFLHTPRIFHHLLKQASLVGNLKVSQLSNIKMMSVTM